MSEGFFAMSGLIFGFFISLCILCLNLDKSLSSNSLKKLSLLNWSVIGLYAGYTFSIGKNANNKLGLLGNFYLIASAVSISAIVFLYIVSTFLSIRERFPYIYKKYCESSSEFLAALFTNLVVAEAVGNMVTIYSGLVYYLLYYFLNLLAYLSYYSVLVFFALILASKYITKQIIKRKKYKL
jgi:hypothetical protein